MNDANDNFKLDIEKITYRKIFEKAWDEVKEMAPIKVSSPSDVVPLLADYATFEQEHFGVVTLDASYRVKKVNDVSTGILNRAITHPREVYRRAIIDNAVAVILFHNHPSGENQPSVEDKELTNRLVEAGKILGINVLDHIIVSLKGYYSFLDEGEL